MWDTTGESRVRGMQVARLLAKGDGPGRGKKPPWADLEPGRGQSVVGVVTAQGCPAVDE